MALKQSFGLNFAALCLAAFGVMTAGGAMAQSPLAVDILIPRSKPPSSPVDPKSALAQTVAPADAKLERMLLVLKPSSAQEQALDRELARLSDPKSTDYHHWLTPSAFAANYANSAEDAGAVAAWLASEGFQVAPLPSGRGWIEFSGTVSEVEQAFHTRVNAISSERFVLADSISAPAALAPLVAGLASLDGSLAEPALTRPLPVFTSAADLAAQTSFTEAEALTPWLAGQLLHLDSLHQDGTNGTGETIAIAARSRVNASDIAAFRASFGLPASPLAVTPDSPDPGLTSELGFASDQAEATLAASWAGAAAPGARILLVPASTTGATDGLDLSLAAIVDRRLAEVVAIGHSVCEAALAPAHQAFYAMLYRQAAAEGISIVAASGDSGPSACHAASSAAPVSSGYAVNALASTPWNVAIGAAALNPSNPSLDALSLSAWSPGGDNDSAYAGGGGRSTLYAAPGWQPIPAQFQRNAAPPDRLLPDAVLPTAIDSATSPGLAFCLSTAQPSSGCTLVRAGGSSAAAALFAGIAALIDQKYSGQNYSDQKNGDQGNLAPRLYALSRQSGIFNDIDQGNAQLRCLPNSPGCGPDERIGFTATPGYDLTTGLGSVDAQALVSRWATPQTTGTGAATVTLTPSPSEPNSTYNPTATVTLTAVVTSGTGGATPTGTVTFLDTSEAQPVSITPSNLDSTGTATLVTEGKFGPGGNEITAEYSGDSNYAAVNSAPPININIQPSTTSIAVVPSATSVTPGQAITVTATLTVGSPPEGSVAPAGVVTLNLDGLSAGTASLATSAGVTSATFSITIPSSSSVLTHALQAVYAGNTNYSASTSPSVSVTVAKNATTTVVTPATTTPSAGSSLAVTATITATTSGSTAPTGTVTFLLDNVSQGVSPITAGTSITASITIPTIAAGTHVLQATYSGDGNYATSTSPAVTITAAKGATTTTLTATPPVLSVASTETLTATVAPLVSVTGTVYTLTGSVSFYDGGTVLLGTAVVTSGAATLSGVTLANNVSHSITALYSGDTNWLASTSAALPLSATTLADSVVLTSNLSTLSPGQALVLTATVTPTALPVTGAEQNPTGNVVFYDGTSVLATVALVASQPGDSSIATYTSQTLPGGQDALTAFYVGDLYYNAATSNVLTLDVEDFTIVPSSTNPGNNLNVVQGTSGSASFVIGGLGGYNNTVQVICAVPSQDDMTCTTSPQQINPPGSVTFVVQTFLPGQQTTTASARHRAPPFWPRTAGGAALAVLAFFLLPFGRRGRVFADHGFGKRMLILLLLLAGLAGAGIGCSSIGGVNGSGTPLGVATLEVTATAYVDNTVVSHSVYFTVDVLAPGSTP